MTDYKENIANLIDSSGNLHSSVIKDYIHGILKPADAHAVERHLLNSPFDAEVVEGYLTLPKNKSADYYVNQIKDKIPSIVGPAKTLQINYKLIAASFIGLLGLTSIGYLVSILDFSSPKEEIAVIENTIETTAQKTNPVIETVTITDTLTSNEDLEEEANNLENQEVPTEKPAVKEIATVEPVSSPKPVEITESKDITSPEGEPEIVKDEEMDALKDLVAKKMVEEPAVTKTDPSPEMLAYSKEKTENPKVSKKYAANAEEKGFTEASELRDEKSLMDEAGVRFKKKQYADAAKFYDLVLNSNPSHQTALTYGGLSNLYTANYSKAAQQLSQVSPKSDMIKWSLATAYLKTGRKESAKSLLNDLAINGSSAYQKKAKEVLATF